MELGTVKLTWTKIAEGKDKDLYLCDHIVRFMPFSKDGNNDWMKSDVRKWLNTEFAEGFYPAESARIVEDDNGDKFFLLSKDEYERNYEPINTAWAFWWLRSPGYDDDYAAAVDYDGGIYYDRVDSLGDVGVRPAMWVKR